jgi:hypothetical protein
MLLRALWLFSMDTLFETLIFGATLPLLTVYPTVWQVNLAAKDFSSPRPEKSWTR